MELKDATHFLLLKEYILEKNKHLHIFENLIIQDCLKYYSEPQIFFFIKKEDFTCSISYLQERYKENLVGFATSSIDTIKTNSSGEIWICKPEVCYQEIREYKNGKELIRWEPYIQDSWQSFPGGLFCDCDYKILFEDSFVKIVVFYKKLELKQTHANEKNLVLFSYQKSLQKKGDIFYKEEDAISYNFMDNSETMQYLGITEYFKWLRFYEDQENILKRELSKTRC